MLNAYQFSAAKTASEAKALQYLVYNEERELKTFQDFKNDAEEITDIVNDTWLRTEYDNCGKCAVMGEEWNKLEADKDLYPYWVYHTTPEHEIDDECDDMNGMVFRIDDEDSDNIFPPNHFNCQCFTEPVDDSDIEENGYNIATPEDSQEFLRNSVDEDFRFNPGKQGSLPNSGNYFDDLPSANDSDWKLFDLPPISDSYLSSELYTFAAKGMSDMMRIYQSWKDEYHLNNKHQIIFQNKKTFANVKFDDISFHNIEKNMRGFENLPDTIANPDEIWSYWFDKGKQQIAMRNYITYGKINYCVITKAGHVQNAFAFAKGASGKYRKGIILL